MIKNEHDTCGHAHDFSVFRTEERGWRKAAIISAGAFRLFLCPGDDIAAASVAASSVGVELGEERNAVLPAFSEITQASVFKRPKRRAPILVRPKRKV